MAAQTVRSATGTCGSAAFTGSLDYRVVPVGGRRACGWRRRRPVRSIGATGPSAPQQRRLDCQLDDGHGIRPSRWAAAQFNVHTVSEKLDIAAFHKACRIALRLVTGMG